MFIEKLFSNYHPWTNWGFWDGFWFVIIITPIIYAYIKAGQNKKGESNG